MKRLDVRSIVFGACAALVLAISTVTAQDTGTPEASEGQHALTLQRSDGSAAGTANLTESGGEITIALATEGIDAGEYGVGVIDGAACDADLDTTDIDLIGTIAIGGSGAGRGAFDTAAVLIRNQEATPDPERQAILLLVNLEDEGGVVACGVIPSAGPENGTPTAVTSDAVVVMSFDIYFEPTEVIIPANTDVTFELPNNGVSLHTFSIDALGIDVFQDIGETYQITINAPAGEYQFYCKIEGHKDAGMVGTLIVQ